MMHFVNTVRKTKFNPEAIDQDTEETSKKIQKRTQEYVGQQHDPAYLNEQCLPPVPKDFKGPIV